MRFEVLGHTVGAPLGGACSGYLVHASGGTILLDCGPGTLERVWRRGLADRLAAIVLSHAHADHLLDLVPWSTSVTAGELAHRRGGEASAPTPLYLPREHGPQTLAALVDALGLRDDRFSSAFALREYDEGDRLTVAGSEIGFARTAHPVPCFAPRIEQDGRTIVYGADGAYSDALVEHARDADLLVLEATYLDPDPGQQRYGHLTGQEAGEIAAAAGARRLLLTHLLPRPDENLENLARARAAFGGTVDLAREDLTIVV
ncbi:MBL fold metallo-hydrolase [Patulibacter defluvii]|uniref:MBL fold metallo-hydrolase n=1 Tax=Patulibacter defluvii TaxID=3095358 RepID=UPI002A75C182|nr:MBL fold metallo-hydrolase [Patulibacter sp. DM4]